MILEAKDMGKYTGRKTKEYADFDKVVSEWRKGNITAANAMKRLGMSRSTFFYRRVKT